MRPRSITGPLILVAIGVVFLLNNVWHDIPLWSVLTDYWPLLLIAIGVIGLVEVLYHVSRGALPPPRPLAGTGFIWIILVLCFCFWGGSRNSIHLGRLDAGGITILGTDYEYDVKSSSSASGISRVVLDNLHGNITVKGESGGDIAVTGRKTVRAFNRNDADHANGQSRVHMERQGDLLVIRAEEPTSVRMLSVSTDLDITVPAGLNLEARGRSGDLTVNDMTGSLDISNGHGDVRLNNIGKDVKIESSRSGLIHATGIKGNLDLEGRGGDVQMENIDGQVTINGEYSGTLEFHGLAKPLHFQSARSDFRAQQIPGNLTIDLGNVKMNNIVGPVRFQTGTRDIQATDVTNSLELTVDHGDIQVAETKSPLPKMEVHSRNGDITVTVPASAAFEADGRTGQGEAENGFGDPLTAQADGRAGTIKGRVGSGPVLSFATERGNIAVKKN